MTYHQNKFFLSSVIKALEIKKKFRLYTSEKGYAKAECRNAELNKCLCTKFSESFNSVIKAQKNERNASFFNKILADDSSENFILKSVLGFLGGILLTYICFMFLVFSLNFTLKRATYICMVLGVILSLGLAFSVKIRCTVFLCIPQLFSKRGRQALLAYAFILALSGPAKNTLHNVEVMSESLACTQVCFASIALINSVEDKISNLFTRNSFKLQEQLKQTENELSKCVQKPNAVAKKSIEKLLEKINCAVKDFKHFILQLYKTCFDILQTVFQTQKWLYSISLQCQKEMGKPAHRCLNYLTETRENCESSVPFEPWRSHCKINPYIQEIICSVEEQTFCKTKDLTDFLPVLKLQEQLKAFKHRAMNTFYVSVESHQFYAQTNRSFTYHEEYQGMATEIRQKTDQFLQYFDLMSVIFGIFILVLFVKVIIYRHKFLTQDHFDNRYITSDFVDIDNTRAAFQMETLLPLTCRERKQYIKVWSVRLMPAEKVQLFSSFVFLTFATFKIIIHMLTDSSLYWILSTIRREERLLYISTIREDEILTTVRVVGDGLVAALIQNVTRAVKRGSPMSRLDPTPCLPDPVPPDYNRYCQIIALVIICWFLALCEPYGLRLRHTVMVIYHPDRARERAIWLYNRIISNRFSYAKTSRRQLRRKYKGIALEKTFRYKFMRKTSSLKCLLCESTIYSFDNYVKCSSIKCLGIYCASCFEKLKFCCICSDPAKYGDLSDISEEKDSSGEEESLPCKSPTEKSEWKKNGFPLNVKKFYFQLYKCDSYKERERKNEYRLIQPITILQTFQNWKKKIPTFTNFGTFSEVESSDWDLSSSLITGESCLEESSSEKSGKEKISKKLKKNKKSDISEKFEKRKKAKIISPKICFHRKPSKVDFNFPVRKLVFNLETRSPKKEAKPKSGKAFTLLRRKSNQERKKKKNFSDLSDENYSCKLKAIDSVELLKNKRRKCSYEMDEEEEDSCSGQTEDAKGAEDTRAILELMEINKNFCEPHTSSSQVFPFIDPVNVQEFDSKEDSEVESFKIQKEIEETLTGKKKDQKQTKPEKKVKTVRLCYGTTSSSKSTFDNVKKSVKLCCKDETGSSNESGGQFYSQLYRSSDSYLTAKESNSFIKGTLPKLNLDPKNHKICSLETDSSNDDYYSVKTSRKTRKKPTKQKDVKKEPDAIQELLGNSSQGAKSKRNDFFKAKMYQFYKKNMRERKSSMEDGSTDIDDVESTPNTAVLLSDEEFEKISKQISSRKAKDEKVNKKKDSGAPCSPSRKK